MSIASIFRAGVTGLRDGFVNLFVETFRAMCYGAFWAWLTSVLLVIAVIAIVLTTHPSWPVVIYLIFIESVNVWIARSAWDDLQRQLRGRR